MIKIDPPAKIKTKEFTFNLKDKAAANQFVESFNYVPFLYFSKLNDNEVPPEDGNTIDADHVVYVKLFNSMFLPEIEIRCYDKTGKFFNDLYPFDHNTLISIFVKSSSEKTMPIRMDFRLTEFHSSKSGSKNFDIQFLMRGILDVDDLHYTRYEVRKGTSFKIIRDIALEMNLGWGTNISDSNDEMKWINPSETYLDFILDTTRRAYIDEKSFVWTFIDFQYNLNYINVETEVTQNIIDEQQTTANPALIKDDNEDTTKLYLTNNPAFQSENFFIEKFEIINQSYLINLEKAYRMKSTWYDKNENKTYRQFLLDLETEDKNQDPKKLVNLYDYDSKIFNENINDDYYIGKVETDNVHKNYAVAKPINEFNIRNLEKMKMVIILKRINFSIKRFQNIRVEIYNINDMLSKDADTKKAANNINRHLSGFWLVTGINYIYKREGGNEQEITLVRRDLSIDYGSGKDDKNEFRNVIIDDTKVTTDPNAKPNNSTPSKAS